MNTNYESLKLAEREVALRLAVAVSSDEANTSDPPCLRAGRFGPKVFELIQEIAAKLQTPLKSE